ncbi:MAG: ion transporter [Burkholderiaceae bacterium]
MQLLRNLFSEPSTSLYRNWKVFTNFLIIISCIAISIETVESIADKYEHYFKFLEFFTVFIFILDYLGNIAYAKKRLKYIFSFWGLIDLLSILPTLLQSFNLLGFQSVKLIRTFQVARMIRILKMLHTTIEDAQSSRANANPIKTNLKIYFTGFFMVTMISSTLMYYVEGGFYTREALEAGQAHLDVQTRIKSSDTEIETTTPIFMPVDALTGNDIPEDKRFFTSIPNTIWWSILAITGNGDMFPVTLGGRVIACITYFLGLILFGVLINIVGKSIMTNFFIDPSAAPQVNSKQELLSSLIQQGWIGQHEAEVLSKLSIEEINRRMRIIAKR